MEVVNSNPNGDPDRESDPSPATGWSSGEHPPPSRLGKLAARRRGGETRAWFGKPSVRNSSFRTPNGSRSSRVAKAASAEGHRERAERGDLPRTNTGTVADFEKHIPRGGRSGHCEDRCGPVRPRALDLPRSRSSRHAEHQQSWESKKGRTEAWPHSRVPDRHPRSLRHAILREPNGRGGSPGCTAEDIKLLFRLIPQAYAHSASYVRPLVGIRHAWIVEHKSPLGSCSDFDLLDALRPTKKKDPEQPSTSSRVITMSPVQLPKSTRGKAGRRFQGSHQCRPVTLMVKESRSPIVPAPRREFPPNHMRNISAIVVRIECGEA